MCADQTLNSSGKAARSVGVESKKARGVVSVRKLRAEDVDTVIAIVEESPQAAIWSRASHTKFA
jgi:hypothetical protein